MAALGILQPSRTAFFLCDLQERFRPAVLYFKEIVTNTNKLIQSSKILNIELLATEQYPKGLGSTVEELDISHAVGVFTKTKFSMVIPEVELQLKTLCNGQLETIVLFGIEAHVCIEQTALDLRSRGLQVHVVADATSSRSQEDRLLAFQRLQQAGCFISTSESIIFKLLQDKENPQFNGVKQLVKTTSMETGLVSKF